jgi:hypothetical protein
MKKLLLLFLVAVIAVLTVPTIAEAGNHYVVWWGVAGDTVGQARSNAGWKVVKCDTITVSRASGACDTFDLGDTYYNLDLVSLNGAADSGSVNVTFDCFRGISHSNAVAQAYLKQAVGLNSDADHYFCPIGVRYIIYYPIVGGDHDSTCTLLIKAVR